MLKECEWCAGTGYQYIGREYEIYQKCADCDGIGSISVPTCSECDKEYEGEYCDDCYAPCVKCGEVSLIKNQPDGYCEKCYNKLEVKK